MCQCPQPCYHNNYGKEYDELPAFATTTATHPRASIDPALGYACGDKETEHWISCSCDKDRGHIGQHECVVHAHRWTDRAEVELERRRDSLIDAATVCVQETKEPGSGYRRLMLDIVADDFMAKARRLEAERKAVEEA